MRALWLDYQRPEPGQRRPGLIFLTASLLATGGLLTHYFSVAADLDAAMQQVSQLKRAAAHQPPLGAVDANAHSTLHWDALFTSLETAGDDSVTLLALRPGSKEILITGEAKDLGAAMAYLQRLRLASVFADVHLTQSEVVIEHPQRPVRFVLASAWGRGAP